MNFDISIKIRQNLEKNKKEIFISDKTSKSYIQKPTFINDMEDYFTLAAIPNDGFPVYCHSSFMSILFCEGNATVTIGSQKTVCFSGNIFLFREGCNFVVEPGPEANIYLALYKNDLFDSIFSSEIADCPILYDFFLLKNGKGEFLYFDCNNEMNTDYSAKLLQLELCQQDSMSNKMVRSATILFLSNLHRIHRTNLVINESSMMKDYMIGNILKYMADNMATASLSSTAAQFNYHPAYFSSMFQKKASCNFSTKMQEMKLEQARRLLISSKISIQQICENIGFKEKSHFYRCFKHAYNLTPGEYRKLYRHKSSSNQK